MQFEVSVALNFLIAYLYNKLPRRRVNMLGEQMLEHLRIKFQGHWYPERPTKGSAYRSIRISKEKVDKVLINAANDVGLDLQEILDTLPNDLTIWIDPGEVSYRIGEKGPVKILYEDERRLLRKNTNKDSLNSESSSDSEEREGPSSNQDSDVPIRPFNPDAQIFRPIPDNFDTISLLSNSINSLISLSPTSSNNTNLNSSSGSSSSILGTSTNTPSWTSTEPAVVPTLSSPTVATSPNTAFLNKTISTPVFSPQTFAQTKFGSLKSKHVGKRNQSKMLPSEFSAYIKQKEQIQQSRVLPMPFIDNNNSFIPATSSAIIRPPNYRNYFNPHITHSQLNSASMFNNDLPLRPNTLPLTAGQSSIFTEQQMTSSTS
ncbi:unnamed protein product [Rotaria magnacalcarata]|uniref:Anti-proliferative protein domain-containing protein n=6 Tax=Rotaria TaxID=231623 RepID=A0A815NKT8_9BILA|nr:unnamed protein product [Rotaria magnacalcarata]CAF1438962.1 unnamed protein product [Rotaria magnacalcarata]CAF1920264.1 unnamed protein product [Rotaria magnacalcarata]CAF2092425.1 unnamed protein product [Rotaria magnacalcarata]CAF2129387.1 unnamed protein product [Rotaria magnacalcarata]